MKYNKILLSGLMVTTLCTPMSAMALSVSGDSATVPVNATIAATPIDVTVSDAITVNVATNTVAMNVSDFEVTNNSTAGVIGVSNVHVEGQNSWTKVADTTEFEKLAMNAKQFSMMYGAHDLATDFATKETIDPTVKKTYQFAGKTGGVTTAVDAENIANVVLTIAYE